MKKTLLRNAAVVLCLMAPAASLGAATFYVAPDGTGDGSSWATAAGDLQAVIDAASAGDAIYVAKGVYKPSRLIKTSKKTSKAFFLKDGVSLYGGFAGTEASLADREVGNAAYEMSNATVLDADDEVPDVWARVIAEGSTYRWEWELEGNQVTGTSGNSSHLLYAAATLAQPTVIDGFTLKGANANVATAKPHGGAVYAPGKVTVKNCIITENSAYFTAEANDCNSYGGAVYLDGGTMADCYVARTYCHSSYGNGLGGAVYARNSAISGCVFEDCVGLDGGGAVYMVGGTLDNCTFERCYSSQGGAVYNAGGTVNGVFVHDCRGLKGGGIYNKGKVTDAIVLGCYADATEYSSGLLYGGAVYSESGDLAGIVACNNTAYDGGAVYLAGGRLINATVQNNSVRNAEGQPNVFNDGGEVLNTICATGVNPSNFTAATTFSGRAGNDTQAAAILAADWSLAAGSEFIDAGTPVDGYAEGTDLAGNPRISGAAIDLGAYEAQGDGKVPTIILTFAPGTEAVRIGTGGASDYEFSIDWGDGVEVPYSGQNYYSSLLKGSTVKIYGDDVILLYAIDQGVLTADMSRASKLQRIQLQNNGMTSLALGQHPLLDGIYAGGNALTSLDVAGCPAIRVLDLHENQLAGTIDCSAMVSLSKVDVADNALSSLVLPQSSTVYEIDCSNNNITALDVTGLSGLDELDCSGNSIAALDLTGLASMTALRAGDNRLATIDLAPASSLETVVLYGNMLEAVDLSANTSLSGVYLQDNKLTALDITANPSVRWLNVGNNNISELNVAAQIYLSILIATNNRLSTIDLSHNASLTSLDLAGNMLSAIDVSKASYLSQFHIENNALTTLDLSKNTYLYGLFCGNNRLASLDLSKNTWLQRLEAQGNALAALDITANTGLQEILIQSNKLDAAALAALVAALPDVSNVTVTPDTDFLRKLDISFNPGTAAADVAPAEAKGWYVTALADATGEVSPAELNMLINSDADGYLETFAAEIKWADDDHTALIITNFMGLGSNLSASIDADGSVKIYPQVCGMDDSYNFLMIVNADNVASGPMDITATYVAGTFDGATLALEPWNLIVVPYNFAENLGTVFDSNITSQFVKSNGTIDLAIGDRTVTQPVYAVISDDDIVSLYGWCESARATIARADGKWTVDNSVPAIAPDVLLSAEGGAPLVAAAQPDARTLQFGAWTLGTAADAIVSGSSATIHLPFDLPAQSGITDANDGAEVVSTVYYNAAGVASPQPFDGFNIRVDTLSDGTVRTAKQMLRR